MLRRSNVTRRLGGLALVAVLLLAGCGGDDRFASGHPLDSTTVERWVPSGEHAVSVELAFRDDAPSYGCEVDAYDRDGKSLGFVIAKPRGQETRTMTMPLDRGTSDEVERVAVADCDI